MGASIYLIPVTGLFLALLAPSPVTLQTWLHLHNSFPSRFWVARCDGVPSAGSRRPPLRGAAPALPGRLAAPAVPARPDRQRSEGGACQHLPAVRIGNPIRAGRGPGPRAGGGRAGGWRDGGERDCKELRQVRISPGHDAASAPPAGQTVVRSAPAKEGGGPVHHLPPRAGAIPPTTYHRENR